MNYKTLGISILITLSMILVVVINLVNYSNIVNENRDLTRVDFDRVFLDVKSDFLANEKLTKMSLETLKDSFDSSFLLRSAEISNSDGESIKLATSDFVTSKKYISLNRIFISNNNVTYTVKMNFLPISKIDFNSILKNFFYEFVLIFFVTILAFIVNFLFEKGYINYIISYFKNSDKFASKTKNSEEDEVVFTQDTINDAQERFEMFYNASFSENVPKEEVYTLNLKSRF